MVSCMNILVQLVSEWCKAPLQVKEDESRVAHIVWEESSLSQQFHNFFMSTSSLLCCLLYIQNGSSDTGSEEGKHFYSITITYAQDCSGKHYPGEKGGRKARDWGGEGWGGSWHCYVSSHHVGLTDSNICAIICGVGVEIPPLTNLSTLHIICKSMWSKSSRSAQHSTIRQPLENLKASSSWLRRKRGTTCS